MQNKTEIKSIKKAIKGIMALKNKGYAHKEQAYATVNKNAIFNALLLLNFSQLNTIPEMTVPIVIK